MARDLWFALGPHLHFVTASATSNTIGIRGADCDSDLFKLIPDCIMYILPGPPDEPPSQACCNTFQKVDVPCLCAKVDKGIIHMISMEKVVYVADYCKRPFTPGTKCGEYTIPPKDQ
ncbi:hypothetical protein ACP70R_038497 [Stipagrostis hirtigluma subsp. patula]